MRFVIQRVKSASVSVENQIVGQIEKGIMVLVGFSPSDNKSHIPFAANKLLSLRLWDDDKGRRWASGVKDKDYGILLVSQFTLYSTLKGNKPDFHNAMNPDEATILYNYFLDELAKNHKKVQAGKFGALMEVSLINDGPVTIEWEYPSKDAISTNSESFNFKDDKIANKLNSVNNKTKENKIEKVNKEKKEKNDNKDNSEKTKNDADPSESNVPKDKENKI